MMNQNSKRRKWKKNTSEEEIEVIKLKIEEDVIKEVAKIKLCNMKLLNQMEAVVKEKNLTKMEVEKTSKLKGQLETVVD